MTNKKLISYGKEYLHDLENACCKIGDTHLAFVRNAIKALEQEPRKGHWIKHPHERGINWEYPMYECSECHEWAEDNSDFCPNCGADMSEDKE